MIQTAEFGGVASAQLLDVSNFQGAFDWAAARRSLPSLAGGIFKVTEGLNFTDPDAAHNLAGVRAQGIWGGGYHFLHPADDGRAQAQFFASHLRKLGIGGQFMLWCDNETQDGRTASQVAACASAFMDELHTEFPHNPMGVYTFVSFATGGENAGLGRWPLWLARPGSTAPVPPPPWSRWTFWQWGTRNGVDADAFNGTAADLSSWIKSFAPARPTPGPDPSPSPSPAPSGWMAGDGKTTLREMAHQHGVSALDLVVATADARNGQLGGGEQALFSQLVNDGSAADQAVPAGVLIKVPS